MEVKLNDIKPSCFNCIHGKFVKGYPQSMYDPGEPDTIECQHPVIDKEWGEKYEEIFDKVDHNEDELPEVCGHFQPQLIHKCGLESCQKEMNAPVYNWPLYAYHYYADEPTYVCGEDCKTAIEVMAKLERSIDEENEKLTRGY